MALEFIAGCLGGCAGVLVGHPLDTVKVRLQTQDALNPKYKGTWHCIQDIVQKESVKGLYKGMASPLAGVSLVNAIIFGVHGNVMKKMSDPDAVSSHAVSGATAGFVQAFIASPMELAKTQLQVQTSNSFSGPMACIKHIFQSEGIKGIFRGLNITILREIPAFTTYFASYQYLTSKLASEDEGISTPAALFAGGTAGMASWVVCYPMDVVKTRLQVDGMEGPPQFKGMVDCFKKSISTQGYSLLTRGLSTTIIRSFPTNAATFAVVNQVMSIDLELPDMSDSIKHVINRGEIMVSSTTNVITELPTTLVSNNSKLQSILPVVAAMEPKKDEKFDDGYWTPDERLE